MDAVQSTVVAMLVGALVTGCQTQTVNYNPATKPDSTPPAVNVLIKRYGAPDLEVQKLAGPSANVSANLGALPVNGKFDFSVLATATDNESGIRNVKLLMMRTVCNIDTPGSNNKKYFGTVTRKESTYTDQTQAPTQVSLGDTGLIDNTNFANANPTDDNLLVWLTANATLRVGVGVWTKWSMEATNFAGLTTYSDTITIAAGDLGCNPP